MNKRELLLRRCRKLRRLGTFAGIAIGLVAATSIASATVIGAPTEASCMIAGQNDRDACYIVTGTSASLYGVLGGRTALQDFQLLLTDHPDVTEIVFVDVPGSGDDDINVQHGRALRAAGLDTRVAAQGLIASGGVDLFLAGASRAVGLDARVGVHSWSDGITEGSSLPMDHPDHASFLDYYSEIGFDRGREFYFFTLAAAPSSSIHYLTQAEVARFGVASVPEPATSSMIGVGLMTLAWLRRRRLA